VLVLGTAAGLRSTLSRSRARTEQLALDERRAADELRELERLRSSFLQSVSHELRTPLTYILGYGETIRTHLADLGPERIEQLTDRMIANGRRLEHLVLDLLDLHRVTRPDQPLRLEELRIDELLHDVVGRRDTYHGLFDVRSDVRWAELDRGKVSRLIAELVDNVVRHTPQGTAATFRVTRVGADDLRLSVVDHGPGIATEVQGSVVLPFVQGAHVRTAAQPGLGIGLPLAARYAELHGGDLTLGTSTDGGTRVDVLLPNCVRDGA